MIKTVFRFRNNMVMVFDKWGEQIPKYQGQYEKVILLLDVFLSFKNFL